MNQQRQQAYLNFIQDLLSCPYGEELEILASNRELFDTGLVHKMLERASNLLKQGELSQANRLMNIVGQQLGVYNKLSSTTIEKEYLDFLKQTLKVTADSRGNAQLAYPILIANIKKIDNIFVKVLRDWAKNKLTSLQPDEGKSIASNIVDLSKLIQEFPLGDKANNIEIAIAGYEIALNIFNRTLFPRQWAMIQNNLGIAYFERIQGDRVENQECAIKAFTCSLEIITCSKFPQLWAGTLSNLGNIYLYRVKGNRTENLECAIKAYTTALEVITHSQLPEQWAMVQNNLGNVYLERQSKDKKDNIENAIIAYTAALEVYTCFTYPKQWLITQNNLGNAYLDRVQGDRKENVENAIVTFSTVLKVFSHIDFPELWAMVQNNLGNAYRQRIQGDRKENFEKAIEFCTNALKVFTHDSLTQNHALTLSNIGILYQEAQKLIEAYTTFNSAIKIVESLRGEIISGDESKRKQAEEWNKLYRRMVQVCLELKENTQAIEYAERSKTRNLVELILNRSRKTIFPPDVVTLLEQLRDKIAAGQHQLQNGIAENPTALAQHLQKLRQQRQELQDKYLPVGSGFKFDQFRSTLDNHTAVIEWYITDNKILAFIIKPKPQTSVTSDEGGEVILWQSQPEDLTALINWINEYLQGYYQQKDEWQNQLESRLKKLAEILHIEEILSQIPKHYDKLILIPHRYLHLFPLHALSIQESCLLELYPNGVSYAPSCQLLQLAQQRQREDFQSIFAIQNPTEDLLFTDLEVNSILPLFPSHQVLPKAQATKNALSDAAPQLEQANFLHFSCHGLFNPNSPLDSCLVLAGADMEEALDISKCLTLGNLFDKDYNLNQCRLVTLSACETGLIDFTNTSDEYIGLPSGFIYAGSKSVVSSLWTVNDLSTSMLMIRFYQNLKAGSTIAVALNQAQLWLRASTHSDLWEWTQQLNLVEGFQEQVQEYLSWFDSEERPFAKAVY